MGVKLWHDDVRRPPEGWLWARTNAEALRILRDEDVTECSLDHDLGLEDQDPDAPGAELLRGTGPQTGMDLVRAMIEHDLVPPKVTIHSWSYVGAQNMKEALKYDYERPTVVIVKPYEARGHAWR